MSLESEAVTPVLGRLPVLVLGAWTALVLLHGLVRSLRNPEPDPLRPSGPVDP